MSEQLHRKLNVFLKRTRTTEGKITIFTSLVACLVLVCVVTIFSVNVPQATASNVTTSVTVLNTPPTFSTDVAESPASATTTPTNAGTTLSFTVTATDSSNDNYYLLICKTGGAPTGGAGGAAPSCNGGIGNQWAVSGPTASGAVATASTSTINTFPFNTESNDWFGFICDNNAGLSRCNGTVNRGTPNTDSASPFVINHVPVFSSISNNSPQNPGGTVTWTSVSSDSDTLGGNDQVRLVVCRLAGFSNGQCSGVGNSAFATSTLAASNAATSTPFPVPAQDRFYNAFTYIVDDNNLAATSTNQGFNSVFQISNVAPTISAATISLVDTDGSGNLTLLNAGTTTNNFKVQFTVADNNGCLNASSSNEISSTFTNVYRSAITQAGCLSSGQYNSNNCYTASSTLFANYVTCTQDGASCSGASDSDATFTCTFALWFNADPTDANTPYTAQNWLASVRATDDNATSSPLTESSSGNDLVSFLAFNVSTTTVAYGALQPGDTTTPLFANTDLQAIGNVGLDEDVYGDPMCTDWSISDRCFSGSHTSANTIPVTQQVVATGTVAYTTAVASSTITGALPASTTPRSILINVPKTIATSTIQSRNTYWGIAIPTLITLSGNYTGQNTITAKTSAFANW